MNKLIPWVDKIHELREKNINPFPTVDTTSVYVKEYRHIEALVKAPAVYENVSIATRGRIISKPHSLFMHIEANGHKIQIFAKKGTEAYEYFNHLGIGDFIWVYGSLFTTKTGELTINVVHVQLAAKCTSPFPDRHAELSPEVKSRQPYLNYMLNPKEREILYQRHKIIFRIREHYIDHNYVEVETPMLHPIPGGASAKPFVTHHNSLNSDFYLRIAPELYLKRLLVGGLDRVFEIGKNFRNEGISMKHNPEFTACEVYAAWQHYQTLMWDLELLIKNVSNYTLTGFVQRSMSDLIAEYTKLPENTLRDVQVLSQFWLKEHNESLTLSWPKWWEKLFDYYVEANLVSPTFVIDYPAEISPLARPKDSDPELVDRFELYIEGMEIANGFNELNDPELQMQRFSEQAALHAQGDAEAMHFDEDYIRALAYGMPPTAGLGIGIDRLVMLITEKSTIREVISFPTVRPEVKSNE